MNDADDRDYVKACEEVDALTPELPSITPANSEFTAERESKRAELAMRHAMDPWYPDKRILFERLRLPISLLDNVPLAFDVERLLRDNGIG